MHLEKIVASALFVNSPQLCRFLRFVVEQEINGQGGQLKEYLVATAVLGKNEAFDPRIDTVVRTEARRLRRKLAEYYQAEGAADSIAIELPKGGYRPIFRKVAEEPIAAALPQGPSSEIALSPEVAGSGKTGNVWWAAMGLLAAGLAGFWFWIHRGEHPSQATHPPSIAVLPLENLSADPEQEYFSDGMTDALITSLASIPGMRVISRTSVLQYKRAKTPLPEIARQLGVDYVVEGTVLRAGEVVRITTKLIAFPKERHIWAEAYDRERKVALAMQAELAGTIASRIDIHVNPPARTPETMAVNPEAQDNYLKGRYHWYTRRQDGLLQSVQFFERAIAAEPRYALAYAGLSDSYSVLSGRATGPDRKDLMDRARQAALKALALDESLGDAHVSLAVSSWDWDWQQSEREFRRALELNPGDSTAHQWYAGLLTQTGRPEDGVIEARKAVELSPMSPSPFQTLGWALYMTRQYDRSIRHFLLAIDAFPDFVQNYAGLGLAYEAKGMHREAGEILKKGVALTQGAPPLAALLAHVHAAAGEGAEASRLLGQFRQRDDITPVVMALLSMDTGNRDQAFAWLDRGVEEHSMFIDELKVEPLYDSLRTDPRFTALLRKMRLSQ